MSELPYTTGLTDEFTTLAPTSVSASEWVNQKGTTNFVLQNAEFADDTITLTGNNVAWLPIAEPMEYTAYILCKTYIPSSIYGSSSTYGEFFGCRNGTNRCYIGVSLYNSTDRLYRIRTYKTSTYYKPTMDNWHVITLKRTSGYYYVYADGELIHSEVNSTTTRGNKFMIKSIADIGSTPTVDKAITVYMKYCAIFNVVQTDRQTIENTNQILVDFGIKLPPHNTRLAGTDAVAIAYAIARNQERAEALRQLKRTYQEGMVDGDGKTTIPYETDDPEPTVETDPENDDTHGETDDGTVIDVSKGIWLTYKDDSGNPSAYVRVYTDNYFWDRSLSGLYEWRKRRICVDIYSADGTQLYSDYDIFWINAGRTCEYMSCGDKSESSLSSNWYDVISIKIRNNCVVPIRRHIIKNTEGVITLDEISERAASYSFSYLAGVSIGTYSKCTNVSPL